MFATNPYGGISDEDSHLDGRVRNITEFVSAFVNSSLSTSNLTNCVVIPQQPLSTVLQPLARIHTKAARPPSPMTGSVAPSLRNTGPVLSFVFPPIATSLRSRTFDPRRPSSPQAGTGSPSPRRRLQTAFQDVLLTIPSIGRLELHRGTVSPAAKPPPPPPSTESSKSPPNASPGKVSISLPTSGLTAMMQAVRGRGKTNVGLGAKMVPLATWDVRKDGDGGEWEEVKGEFNVVEGKGQSLGYERE